jgi:hypothetical protein
MAGSDANNLYGFRMRNTGRKPLFTGGRMTRKRYIPYKHEIFGVVIYTLEKMRRGEWNQDEMTGTAKYLMEMDGQKGYAPPQDLEEKIEKIVHRIGWRIFKFSRLSQKKKTKKGRKEAASYDYQYKHYLLIILLNFKHQIKVCDFDVKEYYKIIEKNITEHGWGEYEPFMITEDLLDKIITEYKKRIFEYHSAPGTLKKGGIQ